MSSINNIYDSIEIPNEPDLSRLHYPDLQGRRLLRRRDQTPALQVRHLHELLGQDRIKDHRIPALQVHVSDRPSQETPCLRNRAQPSPGSAPGFH